MKKTKHCSKRIFLPNILTYTNNIDTREGHRYPNSNSVSIKTLKQRKQVYMRTKTNTNFPILMIIPNFRDPFYATNDQTDDENVMIQAQDRPVKRCRRKYEEYKCSRKYKSESRCNALSKMRDVPNMPERSDELLVVGLRQRSLAVCAVDRDLLFAPREARR